MNDNKKIKRKRPLSHNPLLKFNHDDNFLYDKKFMNRELWLERFNLKSLREKWNRKVKTNFLQKDIKFGSSSKNPEINKVIYKDKINQNDFFFIPNSIPFIPFLKSNKTNYSLYQNAKDKYNDKISYYLSNKNPWNNRTSIEINKDDNSKNFNVHEKIKKDLIIRNKIKNSNESKNISVKCLFYNNKYIQKKEKLKEITDKYVEDMTSFVNKKYIKELKLKKHGKNFFVKSLIFKEMMIRYKELYEEIMNIRNIFKKQILNRNNSGDNIYMDKNEKIQKIKNTYELLFIIINYLKENKPILNDIKDKKSLVQNFFDVQDKDEKLRDKDLNYIKFIKNFGINDDLKPEIHISDNSNKGLLYSRKKNGSCLNLYNFPFQKKKFSEYNISYYHPGTYFLFNEDENEFHAWSCCMNDDKKSRGCCKKIVRIPYFNYDIIS